MRTPTYHEWATAATFFVVAGFAGLLIGLMVGGREARHSSENPVPSRPLYPFRRRR